MTFETIASLERRERAEALNLKYEGLEPQAALEQVIKAEFPGKIALISAFGAESAVLLQLVAATDPTIPIIFLDTRKHFDETLSYRDELTRRLGLRDIRIVSPDDAHLEADDPDGRLHKTNPDRCCHIRKTLPMLRALKEFDCWISGRKRFQSQTRSTLTLFEVQEKWIKFNPLAEQTPEQLHAHFEKHDLPRHPLEAYGYYSIGCFPCTEPASDDDSRSGRWKNSAKTECGIHLPAPGVAGDGI